MAEEKGFHIASLELMQFRSYGEAKISLSPGINCLTGLNGSGKTNVLDALHFLAFTRGFRSAQDAQAIQEGCDFASLRAEVHEPGREWTVACSLVKGRGKRFFVNQKQMEKMSGHIGRLPMVAILPQDGDLVNGAAEHRRRFLDMLISQYDAAYLSDLIRYGQALAQRNALLRQMQKDRSWDRELLALWSEQMIGPGIALHEGRQRFLEAYRPVFEAYFRQLVSEREAPAIQYQSRREENSPEAWRAYFEAGAEKDRVLGYTGTGIHKDDLHFSIDGQAVRHYGSQGQQKTFLLALKLGQYQVLRQRCGKAPLLLLDDIFDNLDDERLARIALLLRSEVGGQVWITDTSLERMKAVFAGNDGPERRFFDVSRGSIRQFNE
jgi:DNA replication and repair protein RecF